MNENEKVEQVVSEPFKQEVRTHNVKVRTGIKAGPDAGIPSDIDLNPDMPIGIRRD